MNIRDEAILNYMYENAYLLFFEKENTNRRKKVIKFYTPEMIRQAKLSPPAPPDLEVKIIKYDSPENPKRTEINKEELKI